MKRTIIINLIVAFIFFPVIMIFLKYGANIIKGDYLFQGELYPNLTSYLIELLQQLVYPMISALFFLLVLCPFQIIKDYYNKKNKAISFPGKVLVFIGIVVTVLLITGSFLINLWLVPWWKNYVYLYASVVLGLIFTPILYFMVDIYSEKKTGKNNKHQNKMQG